ncbi:hypothetical protein BD309DRAFT_958069 [Dichomitus squalens]|nr:hypothetical protein BD309DRAFT_958069 [Dichomitus squalens]
MKRVLGDRQESEIHLVRAPISVHPQGLLAGMTKRFHSVAVTAVHQMKATYDTLTLSRTSALYLAYDMSRSSADQTRDRISCRMRKTISMAILSEVGSATERKGPSFVWPEVPDRCETAGLQRQADSHTKHEIVSKDARSPRKARKSDRPLRVESPSQRAFRASA